MAHKYDLTFNAVTNNEYNIWDGTNLICRIPLTDFENDSLAKEMAERILKQLNCHEDLLEALKEVSPLLDGLINRTPTGKKREELCDINLQVKSAISKAEDK